MANNYTSTTIKDDTKKTDVIGRLKSRGIAAPDSQVGATFSTITGINIPNVYALGKLVQKMTFADSRSSDSSMEVD